LELFSSAAVLTTIILNLYVHYDSFNRTGIRYVDTLACLLHTLSHAETSANRKSDDMTIPRQGLDAGHGGRERLLVEAGVVAEKR
jgi:hypothetical protein